MMNHPPSHELGRQRTRPAGRVRVAAEFQQLVIPLLSQPNLLLLGTA